MATQYRVIKILTAFGPGGPKEETIWEGSDIIALSKQYPPSNIFGADPLGHHEIEDGWIRWDHRFESFQDGKWTECPDPRRRISAELSQLERDIDAENRRDFPGDYEDDEDYYQDNGDDGYDGFYEDDEECYLSLDEEV